MLREDRVCSCCDEGDGKEGEDKKKKKEKEIGREKRGGSIGEEKKEEGGTVEWRVSVCV